MSKTDSARADVQAMLDAGESVRAIESVQAKVAGTVKRAAKDVVISAAASAALGAVTGFGVIRAKLPPQVWVVVTDRRVLMFRDTKNGRKPVGEPLLNVQHADVAVSVKSGVLAELTVADAASGEAVVKLNFGMRKKAAAQVVAAAAS